MSSFIPYIRPLLVNIVTKTHIQKTSGSAHFGEVYTLFSVYVNNQSLLVSWWATEIVSGNCLSPNYQLCE